MKNFKLIPLVLLMCYHTQAISQSCLPEGIIFSSQAQVDSFQINYPGCTEIEGNVSLGPDYYSNVTDITNLNGLSVLTSIKGNLGISGNYLLTNLSGLEGLTSIGSNLHISSNRRLDSLKGLDNLNYVGGNVILGGYMAWINITDLTGLNKLTSIGGNFEIYYCHLTSLEGVDKLTSIGGGFYIGGTTLTNMEGLENLNSIGGDFYIGGANALTGMEGLEGLRFIMGDIHIQDNDALTSLNGLENLEADSIDNLYIFNNNSLANCEAESICNYLENPAGSINIFDNAIGFNNPSEAAKSCGFDIGCLPYGNYILSSQTEIDSFQSNYPGCTQLEGDVVIGGGGQPNDINDLSGLDAINYIGGELLIRGNEALTSLSGLDNLASVGGALNIWVCRFTSLTGLGNLSTVGGNLSIGGNDALTSLTGLENLTSVEGSFSVGSNALSSLTGLDNLNSIGENFWISNTDGLNTLTGLENLHFVGGDITIRNNSFLINLTGIENIAASSIDNLFIYNNPYLFACDVKSICDYLASPNGEIEIHDNAIGCDSQQEVEGSCGTAVEEFDVQSSKSNVQCLPNPFTTSTTIEYELQQPSTIQITIYNHLGKQLEVIQQTQSAGKQQVVWNAEGLTGGVYYCVLKTGNGTKTMKMIKLK